MNPVRTQGLLATFYIFGVFLLVSLTIEFTIFVSFSSCFLTIPRGDREHDELHSHEAEDLRVFFKDRILTTHTNWH